MFALCLNTLGHAKDSAAQAANRRAIVAAQSRLDGARTSKNIGVIMSYLADDFRFYSIARIQQDRETYGRVQVNSWNIGRSIAKRDVPMRFKTAVTQWQWRGPDAVVWTTQTFKTSSPRGEMSGLVRSREYWGKSAKGWQLRQIVELSARMTMNGETVEL